MWRVKKILAPTDLSELSRAGLRYAFEMAASQQSEVVVYSVVEYKEAYPPPPEETSPASIRVKSVETVINERKENLRKFLQGNFAELLGKLEVRLEVELGSAFENIIEKAARESVDLIVMSTHGRTGLDRFIIGSVTEHVVRHSPSAVLSVRPVSQTE